MSSRQNSVLFTQMELVRFIQLTPEERWNHARRVMYGELRGVEMEHRERVACETKEKLKKEREEREKVEDGLRRQREEHLEERRLQEAEQREEEEKKAKELQALQKAEQDQLKQERLHWKKVMQVEEEPVQRPRYTIWVPKEEQQKRQAEAELCRLPKVGVKASPDRLTSDLKNWVGVQKTKREPVKQKPDPNSSTYLLFTAREVPKTEEKPQTPKPSGSLQWLPDILKVGYWMDKYRDHREKKEEKRKLKAEEQSDRWTSFKARQASHASRQND